jgi:predicted dehydrogenase
MSSLVRNPNQIRLAMLGMVDGNGHPYSWSAIINGRYDPAAMAKCGYSVIPDYLGAAPAGELGINGVDVTHIWCDDPAEAKNVARAARIENVVDRPEDVIGQVDAVIIPTDRGNEHVDRARPFVEANLPVFVDKPLVDNEADLQQFAAWIRDGKAILSTSAMRYAREFVALKRQLTDVGEVRLITNTTPKSWERYGIHALEAVYPLLPTGGWEWVANTGDESANVVHIHHAGGAEVLIAAVMDMYGAFCRVNVHGTKDSLQVQFEDTLYAFKAQLVAFVEYLRTGQLPFGFEETAELMKIIIAGIRSRAEKGRRVNLSEISTEIQL